MSKIKMFWSFQQIIAEQWFVPFRKLFSNIMSIVSQYKATHNSAVTNYPKNTFLVPPIFVLSVLFVLFVLFVRFVVLTFSAPLILLDALIYSIFSKSFFIEQRFATEHTSLHVIDGFFYRSYVLVVCDDYVVCLDANELNFIYESMKEYAEEMRQNEQDSSND